MVKQAKLQKSVIILNMPTLFLQPDLENLRARVASELLTIRGIAFAQISPQLTLVQASKNFPAMLSVENVGGKLISKLVLEFIGSEAMLGQVLSGEIPDYYLPRVNRTLPDGSLRYLDIRIVPMNIEAPGQGLLLVVEDVTEEAEKDQALSQERNQHRLVQEQLARVNAELQRQNQIKSLFLSMAVHDLRTPLAAIQGYVELGIESLQAAGDTVGSTDGSPGGSPGDELRDFLSAIQTQIDRLQHLIGDFLDLDLIEQGKLSVYPMLCDPQEIIQDTVKMIGEYARRQGLSLVVEIQDHFKFMVDPSRLRQILYNLLSNAIKYTPRGGEIRLISWADAQSGYVQIKDNGRGISAENTDRLFQLYYHKDHSVRSQIQGTGLGLFIVKFLVEAQNGQVSVSSELGQGSVFTVQFPCSEEYHNLEERHDEE
jgi:signal transduction histidine kinase